VKADFKIFRKFSSKKFDFKPPERPTVQLRHHANHTKTRQLYLLKEVRRIPRHPLFAHIFNRFFRKNGRKKQKNLQESEKRLIFAPDRVHHRFSSLRGM
jgi:hypothetical protein